MAFFATLVSLYPMMYFLTAKAFGLLQSKNMELLANSLYMLGFKAHILFGGIALFLGWMQFSKRLRKKYLTLHKISGRVYVGAVLISGIAGFGIAFFTTGGAWNAAGFMSLDFVWLGTTIMAFFFARNRNIRDHEAMMIYSYAACFAAVTLRVWLPILQIAFHSFSIAYSIVPWLCWIPNLIVAYFLVRRLKARTQSTEFIGEQQPIVNMA
jgi:uncharacterized membrane protein